LVAAVLVGNMVAKRETLEDSHTLLVQQLLQVMEGKVAVKVTILAAALAGKPLAVAMLEMVAVTAVTAVMNVTT
jgi:hypothetical protein